METPLPLQRISVFMPQRMSDEELTAIFVARQNLLAELLSSLDQEGIESIPQHHLIIGQRGMGKSTLLKRLDIELRTKTYKSRFIPFSYPEEQYNIDRFSKFWLNSLDALADTLQTEGEETLVYEIDEQVAAFTTLKDEAELGKRAYQLLVTITGQLKRRPVFLLDNINLIFERLTEENQSRLRKLISEPGAPIFIGASATAFDKNFDYEAPFYDAFIVHYLHQLSFEETLTLFRHLAKVSNQTELQSQLQGENLARLQTLHQLTGGNIRTIVILFMLVAQGFSADVFLDLEALLDQMTPFYKAKFEELSNQSQVVVDALALQWSPSNLEVLRERTSLENNQLSVQIDRLTKMGWVTRLGKRKAAHYELSERFFNVWYLMRRSSRRQRKDLLWLTRFLQAWFSKNELAKRAQAYATSLERAFHEHELAYGIALAKALPRRKEGDELLVKVYDRLHQLYEGDPQKIEQATGIQLKEVKGKIDEAEKKKIKKIVDTIWKGLNSKEPEENQEVQFVLKRVHSLANVWTGIASIYADEYQAFDRAKKGYKNALKLEPNRADHWFIYGSFCLNAIKDLNEAEFAYQRAYELDPTNITYLNDLGELYLREKQDYEKALECFEKGLQLSPNNPELLTNKGAALEGEGDFTQAENYYLAATECDMSYNHGLISLANLYRYELQQPDKALSYYLQVIANDPSYATAWVSLAQLYHFNLNEPVKAHNAYTKALENDEKQSIAWGGLGYLYLTEFKEPEKALNALTKSLELEPEASEAWWMLGETYFKLNEIAKSRNAYEKAYLIDNQNVVIADSYVELLRDFLKEKEKAYHIFQDIEPLYKNQGYPDVRELQLANFALYNENWGIAKKHWLQAVSYIETNAYVGIIDNWQLSAALAIKLGYGRSLLEIFESSLGNPKLNPLYAAIRALVYNDPDYITNEVASEARAVALELCKKMTDYISKL